MKRLVAAGGLLVLVAAAYAQSTVNQQVVVPAYKATLKRIYTPPDDFRQYKGDYALSNGKTLTLSRQHTRMYARIDQQAEHEIVRTGEGKFQALDGQMSMDLAWSGTDSVSGELTYVDESPTVADVPPRVVTLHLANR